MENEINFLHENKGFKKKKNSSGKAKDDIIWTAPGPGVIDEEEREEPGISAKLKKLFGKNNQPPQKAAEPKVVLPQSMPTNPPVKDIKAKGVRLEEKIEGLKKKKEKIIEKNYGNNSFEPPVKKNFPVKPQIQLPPVAHFNESLNIWKKMQDYFKSLNFSSKPKEKPQPIIEETIEKIPVAPEIKLMPQEKKEPLKPEKPEPHRKFFVVDDEKKEVKPKGGNELEKIGQDWGGEIFKGTNLIKDSVNYFEIKKKLYITFSFFVLGIVLIGGAYYSLGVWLKLAAQNKASLSEEIGSLRQLKADKEKTLVEAKNFEKRLKLVKQLFDRHVYWTGFFNLLEKDTIEDVYFSKFSGDNGGSYILDATAKDFKSITRQVEVFKTDKAVQSAGTSGGGVLTKDSKSGGAATSNSASKGVVFQLQLTVDKNIFNTLPEQSQ